MASCSQDKARHHLGTCGNPQNLALSWDIRLFVWPRVVAVGVVVAVGSTGSPPRQVMGQPRGTPPGSGDRVLWEEGEETGLATCTLAAACIPSRAGREGSSCCWPWLGPQSAVLRRPSFPSVAALHPISAGTTHK